MQAEKVSELLNQNVTYSEKFNLYEERLNETVIFNSESK